VQRVKLPISWVPIVLCVLSGTASAKERLYDRPASVSARDAVSIMLENLDLTVPLGVAFADIQKSSDFMLDHDREFVKKWGGLNGYWGVEGSKEEDPAIFLIDGPANLRLRPDGDVIASWADQTPVRLLKSKGDWKLVSNGLRKYGWTHQKNLKPLPEGKVLIRPDSPLGKGFPASFVARATLGKQVAEMLALAKEGKCPPNPTLAEIDDVGGTVPGVDDPLDASTLANARLEAYRNCPDGKSRPARTPLAAPFPKMTAGTCECFEFMPFEGFHPAKTKAPDWERMAKESCEAAQHHLACTELAQKADPGGDRPMASTLVCPKTCFKKL
jgi:hypothetical protein